ncbi:PAS domain S-box protein [Haladaptatus sp. DYF46]|uniref:PAS domain S-box protein n=1 Tax=Haladaptatus sp. DYF46 TaxID=2886041 RepID=UPI001E6414A6|nr:PAS domain S-box protein [Haladaptatus sp. DYF46]
MFESWDLSGTSGRRLIMALGGMYVVAGSGISFTNVAIDWTLGLDLTVFTLVAGPGLVTLYVGYWLPRSEVRTELFSRIAKWCLGGIAMMLGIFLFIYLVTTNAASVGSMLILTSLSCLSGLGMGYNGARAGTRALNADEQRREAERYSKELQRYETMIETVNDGIFVIDEDDYFIHVNDAYAEIVGYDREELLGSHTSLVVVKGLNDLSNELQDELLADDGEPKTYDAILETSSGDRIDVEATVANLPKQAANGRDIVGVVRDVTERNERERQLERQNQRLDSFASMVAHELRNPLMIGQMYCNELPADAAPVAVEYITESFDRIDDIIDVLLVVTQGHETVPESTPVRLGDTARNAWNKVDSPDATLEVLMDGTISADETYVEHLFRNLFENAVEHAGADVTVTVGELPTGFYIADDGPGVPLDARETVFEMGYTTASGNGGMGLGLAFVHELATVYGWNCSLTDSADGGAQFEFTNVTETKNPV